MQVKNLLNLAKKHSVDELIRELNELEKMIEIINLCLFQKREDQKMQKEHFIKKFPYAEGIFDAFNEKETGKIFDKLLKILRNKVASIQAESNYLNSNLPFELMMIVGNILQYFNTLLQYLKKCEEYQTNKN